MWFLWLEVGHEFMGYVSLFGVTGALFCDDSLILLARWSYLDHGGWLTVAFYPTVSENLNKVCNVQKLSSDIYLIKNWQFRSRDWDFKTVLTRS